ncbi:NGG1p interacting factor NIF3 [Pseudomonas sp. HK3]|jgi:hypothetical protein
MYRINVYVPPSHAEKLKLAMFNAGAGRIGLYEHCCWQTTGNGQFKPLTGSDAFIGEVDKLEVLEELKIEMVCDTQCIKPVLAAMVEAHPYEEPAYDIYQALTINDLS